MKLLKSLIIVGCMFSLFSCNPSKTNSLSISSNSSQVTSKYKVIGYLPDWSYSAYKDIDFTTLTHINIAFCNPNSSGQLTCGIPDNEMHNIVAKAHDNNVKVLAALGGGGYGDQYRSLINTSEKIDKLNDVIESFCNKYDLDGVDLDIELDSSDSIWSNYDSWVFALRGVCDVNDWTLTTATAQWVSGTTSSDTFALFDYVNVMAYDNSSTSDHSHSSYKFAVDCLNYFEKQKHVEKEKLILGVPFYGRNYTIAGTNEYWNSYESYKDIINKDPSNYEKDLYGNIAYNGANTITDKCTLAKDYGGIMIWEITLDTTDEYSLLEVIKNEML